MTEFLTENARRAYPLEREWPAGLDGRWAETLVDACVYAAPELGDKRVSLLSVGRSGSSLVFTVGIPDGVAMDVAAPSGHAGFTTVHAESAALKAILAVDGRKVSALVAAGVAGGTVGVPFATRCSGGAIRRVTAITAQGAPPCEKPMYDPDGPHGAEKSVGANEHATLGAYDGIDLEVTSMLPLEGDMLRISAIAAPEAADVEQEPIDLMIRGDECFEVEAVPNADKKSGIVRITSTCKPCCQCDDYKDAVDMLRPAETKVHAIHQVLNAAKAAYEGALAAFNEAKARYVARVNSPANVLVSATAALSGGLYAQSTAEGSRMRITVTMLVENMTMVDVQVAVGDDSSAAGSESGFVVGDSYEHSKTVWTKSGTPQEYDEGRPREPRTLKPGDTLTVAATYCKPNQRSNNASRPLGMKAYCTIQLPGQEAEVREVDVQ